MPSKNKKCARPLSECLESVDTPEGKDRVRKYLETQPYPHYEPAKGSRGLLVRIESDGTRTTGRFVNRKFRPMDEVKGTPNMPVPIKTGIRRALASMRRMTDTQRKQSLIDAGILTRSGKLAKVYRENIDEAKVTPSSGNVFRDLDLTNKDAVWEKCKREAEKLRNPLKKVKPKRKEG